MSNTIRVLRTCNADGTSRNGFQWPLTEGAVVECPDWSPVAECGNGLHGLAEGEGDWGLLNWEPDAVALVLEVDESVVVEIGAKVKFPRAIVRKVGKLAGLLCELACDAKRITAQVTDLISKVGSSDSQLAASGDYSQLAASGDYSRLAASGDYSQLAASGDYSQLAASGVRSQLAASGVRSQLAASGVRSQLAASGHSSQLAASGDYSQLAASGVRSRLAASGDYSRLAASGADSVAISAAPSCTAKTGERGAIALTWHDGTRYRITVGYVGEGLEPDTWYRLDDAGQLVVVENP